MYQAYYTLTNTHFITMYYYKKIMAKLKIIISALSSGLTQQNKNRNKYNNSTHKWSLFKQFVTFTSVIFTLNCISIDLFDYFEISTLTLKRITILFSLISFLFVIRYIFIIRIIYLHSKNKVKTSIFMPSFLVNWIKNYESMGNHDDEQLKKIIDFYYKHMYIYIFIFFNAIVNIFYNVIYNAYFFLFK